MKIFKLAIFLIFLPLLLNVFAEESQVKTKEKFAYYFYHKKNYDRAIKEYKNILSIDPQNPKIHYNLGCLYALIKDYSSALQEFKEALKGPALIKKDAAYNLAVIYGKYLNDLEGAAKYYSEFSAKDTVLPQKQAGAGQGEKK